jgi:phage shock protein PspC (stress-responsive transcriptional regulator)
MNEILRKLSSRKLWMAIAGVATGIAMALGVDSGEIGTVAGAVTALVSVVTYVMVEGKIDAESVKNAIVVMQEAADVIEGDDSE